MKIRVAVASFSLLLSTACGPRAPAQPTVPATPAERLEAILATELTREQDAAFTEFESEQTEATMRAMLRRLAVDSTAPALARANAVLRMGRRVMRDFDTYSQTIRDPDPRVRGATLGVVGPLATEHPANAIPILAQGLTDPEVGIQAKALQELRDRDLELLRFYIDSDPPVELAAIALETVRTAYARGAPLTPSPDGALRRISPAGVELVLRPDTVWPEWDAMSGTLSATPPGGAPRVLGDSVEVVGNVIPAVVDVSGRYVALEKARRIEVHDLETGDVRVVGDGIAPRPLPFSTDFMFFREVQRASAGDGATLAYEIMRSSFGRGTEPSALATIRVRAQPSVKGYFSPLRWIRVVDRGRRFVLHNDQVHNFVLPLPVDDALPFDPEADAET